MVRKFGRLHKELFQVFYWFDIKGRLNFEE